MKPNSMKATKKPIAMTGFVVTGKVEILFSGRNQYRISSILAPLIHKYQFQSKHHYTVSRFSCKYRGLLCLLKRLTIVADLRGVTPRTARQPYWNRDWNIKGNLSTYCGLTMNGKGGSYDFKKVDTASDGDVG